MTQATNTTEVKEANKSGYYISRNSRGVQRIQIGSDGFENIILQRGARETRDYLKLVFNKNDVDFDEIMKDNWLTVDATIDTQFGVININVVDSHKQIIATETVFRPTRFIVTV